MKMIDLMDFYDLYEDDPIFVPTYLDAQPDHGPNHIKDVSLLRPGMILEEHNVLRTFKIVVLSLPEDGLHGRYFKSIELDSWSYWMENHPDDDLAFVRGNSYLADLGLEPYEGQNRGWNSNYLLDTGECVCEEMLAEMQKRTRSLE